MRIQEEIVDDAMISRVETCDNRVMIGESERWENWDQTRFSLGSISNQTVNIGSWGFELVAKSEAIGGN